MTRTPCTACTGIPLSYAHAHAHLSQHKKMPVYPVQLVQLDKLTSQT
jgi:hypothetical protein